MRYQRGKIISKFNDLSKSSLGFSGILEFKNFRDERYTVISECRSPKSITLVIKGGTHHIVMEVKRALEDVFGDIFSVIKSGKILYGASSSETELAIQLGKFSDSFSGTDYEKKCIKAFAYSFMIIPKTLAINAGKDFELILKELFNEHRNGNIYSGVNLYEGGTFDAKKNGIIEPFNIKTQAISSATEVANMILRIDDIIAAKELNQNRNDHYMID